MAIKTVTLYSDGNISSISTDWGQIDANPDGSIDVPEQLVEIALIHGFRREKEKPKPKAQPKPAKPATAPREASLDGFDRFDLLEYCKDNQIAVPTRMTTADLRAFILEKTRG